MSENRQTPSIVNTLDGTLFISIISEYHFWSDLADSADSAYFRRYIITSNEVGLSSPFPKIDRKTL